MGRKVSEKDRRKAQLNTRDNKRYKNLSSNKFPGCIGMFPECVDYDPKDPLEKRPECRLCPYHKVKK